MSMPEECRHCDTPECITACFDHALLKSDDGVVRVDASRCIGCGDCVEDCPFGARFLSPDDGVSETWSHVHHAVWSQPPTAA
jgi:tetrathionate reductase subunit B